MMPLQCYVVDTGWLLEFYRVDGMYTQNQHAIVKKRFFDAFNNRARVFIPVPVLFETATHIAQIKHSENKRVIADRFVTTIKQSVSESNPWIITHPSGNQNVEDLLSALNLAISTYSQSIQNEAFSLVDVVIVQEAARIKKEYEGKNAVVHVWTTEQELKAREPDKEI